MRPFYESPDMFKPTRTNFYDNNVKLKGLCGQFIGYIDKNGEEFISHPVNGHESTFATLFSAKAHIVGKYAWEEPIYSEPITKKETKLQLTLF